MKAKLTVLFLAAIAALTPVFAQTSNLLDVPALPPPFPTNQLAQVVGVSAVATFALNLLPGWDKSATNRFAAHELELEVSPTWKSANASGSTPFVSVGANYFFTRNFGAGLDAITFGNGSGASALDSIHAFALLRKDLGNVAGHLLLGGGRDVNEKRFDGEFGGGIEYRYSTGIGLLVDTRYCYFFGGKTGGTGDHEFLTRVGITLHF